MTEVVKKLHQASWPCQEMKSFLFFCWGNTEAWQGRNTVCLLLPPGKTERRQIICEPGLTVPASLTV